MGAVGNLKNQKGGERPAFRQKKVDRLPLIYKFTGFFLALAAGVFL